MRRPAAMLKNIRLLVVLAVLAATGAACQATPAVASLIPSPGSLVSITVHGGECAGGPCGSTTVIERDGRMHQTAPVAAELGALAPNVLTALDAAVKTTDFAALRARKFTGECPMAYDGQEFIYEFGAPGGTERIATCETEVDQDDPLFVAVTAALAAIENR